MIGNSGTGKTILLTELLSRCIIDFIRDPHASESRLIVVDFDHHLDVSRVARSARRLLEESQTGFSEALLEAALKRVEMIRCYSLGMSAFRLQNVMDSVTCLVFTEGFFGVLQYIEKSVFANRISSVFIDSITALYWPIQFRHPTSRAYENEIFKTLSRTITRINQHYDVAFFIIRLQLFRELKSYKGTVAMHFCRD